MNDPLANPYQMGARGREREMEMIVIQSPGKRQSVYYTRCLVMAPLCKMSL